MQSLGDGGRGAGAVKPTRQRLEESLGLMVWQFKYRAEWLWEARSGRGVSDDLSRACAAASACPRGGHADSARVARALLLTGGNWLISGLPPHRRGMVGTAPPGWRAQPGTASRLTGTRDPGCVQETAKVYVR
jgi:hypothetical protein